MVPDAVRDYTFQFPHFNPYQNGNFFGTEMGFGRTSSLELRIVNELEKVQTICQFPFYK